MFIFTALSLDGHLPDIILFHFCSWFLSTSYLPITDPPPQSIEAKGTHFLNSYIVKLTISMPTPFFLLHNYASLRLGGGGNGPDPKPPSQFFFLIVYATLHWSILFNESTYQYETYIFFFVTILYNLCNFPTLTS